MLCIMKTVRLLFHAGILSLVLVCLGCHTQMRDEPGVLILLTNNIKKLSAPVQCSEYTALAGDPCVIKDGGVYRIFYTGLDKSISGGGIGSATSSNGMDWVIVDVANPKAGKGLVLRGVNDTWQHQLETAMAIKHDGQFFLYYSGYPKVGWPENPGKIGVAVSRDGVRFERPSAAPALDTSPEGYDANGLYSPSVIHDGARFIMVYAGHCYPGEYGGHSNKWRTTASTAEPGIYVLGATSPDGIHWTKCDKPVLSPSSSLPWLVNGVAEPDLIRAPDGQYYLFFTGNLGDDEARLIGVARGATPLGPWQVRPEPLLAGTPDLFDAKGVLAPSVLIEGGILRVWYLTSDGDRHMTGYAEMPWPLEGW
jgi:predicted GH43/DUF377 family glycosyl hydrolase